MDTYGLIGFPLKHSFSAKFFTEKFMRENIDAEYLNFELEDILDIRRVILFNQHLKGLNVTIPYKEKVIPFLHDISPEAERIGAVNVIRIERKPGDMYYYKLTGYNTDYTGFKNSLNPILKADVHRKALILGTGGASKAVAQALKDLNIDWTYVSRSKGDNRLTYNELTSAIILDHKLIVNASPVGTFPDVDNCPDIPYQYLTTGHLLYDLVYNPETTLFLKKGKEQGAVIKNGKEMLELQALAAWEIWNN
ncbi:MULTISPECIES: shikimate dehydrogenase family protein [Proteiniphilum]|jgi:shikimate dehydrogenase|uniref:shikimate dehydrogenase family protein n=1 Tax=Proteiniphilum TaxID=294702 RepID=UPI001EEB4896|nr:MULTISPECIES: shikimate dehydrogenase [Proteiniphilum]MDD4415444.1 shikimate dehydrogenase [Proteiniphilum sp.]ULB35766.1 shikimate dehydrogenase [Proteiniphilum propionicum]